VTINHDQVIRHVPNGSEHVTNRLLLVASGHDDAIGSGVLFTHDAPLKLKEYSALHDSGEPVNEKRYRKFSDYCTATAFRRAYLLPVLFRLVIMVC